MPSREKEEEEELSKQQPPPTKQFRMSNLLKRHRDYDSPMVKKKDMMTQVHNLEEYKTHVADIQDALVVVFFTAPWCRTCLRLKPKMKAMAAGLQTNAKNVKVVQIPLLDKDSALLFKGLGVKSFPFCHIYHPQAGLVEELKLSRDYWNIFQKKLKDYLEGSCKVQYAEEGTCIRQQEAMSN